MVISYYKYLHGKITVVFLERDKIANLKFFIKVTIKTHI